MPGLIAVILMIIAGLLTSLTIAREWETGTMEQLLSTPVRPSELVLGKLSAYFALGITDMLICLVHRRGRFRCAAEGQRAPAVRLVLRLSVRRAVLGHVCCPRPRGRS